MLYCSCVLDSLADESESIECRARRGVRMHRLRMLASYTLMEANDGGQKYA